MKKLTLILAALTLAIVTAYVASSRYKVNANASSASSSTAEATSASTSLDIKIKVIEANLAQYDDDPETHRKLALALVERAEATGDAADYDRASNELDRATTLEPSLTAQLSSTRAALLLSRHRFGQARAMAEEGLAKWSDDTEFLSIAGDAARETGDLAGAERHYTKLVKLAPEKPSSWTRLSSLEEARGNLGAAVKLMERAINASYPRPMSAAGLAWSRTILGEIEAKRGNLGEARKQYMWALNKVPDYPLAVEFMADLDVWEGRHAAAEAGYRKVLQRKSDPKIQLNLARLLERRGERDEAASLRAGALRYYEKVVAGGNEGFLRPLAALDLEAGRYTRAAELAARDMALRPTAESRALYQSVLRAAANNAAVQPVKESGAVAVNK